MRLRRVIRLAVAAMLISLAVWLHGVALSISDGPSRWTAEPRRFTKHLSQSEICDGAALVAAFLSLALILTVLFPEGRKGQNKAQ